VNGNPPIGARVGAYRIEALLGRGATSVVYAAIQVGLGRTVALKLLAPRLSQDQSYRARFEGESRRAAGLDHPNVIALYDAGEFDGQLYLAMRYVDGTDLRTLIRREGALRPRRALTLLQQAADGLDAAHHQGLVHRDVKPANLLVERASDRVYVVDFGLVKETGSPGLTRVGVFLGTIDYAAPEQIEGLAVDARADVYALGCVLYEMLTGERPFDRTTDLSMMHAHLLVDPPRPSERRPELPRSFDEVIARAMAKDRDRRYASGDELADAAWAALR
jgi:serine/threonine-protein kinase